MAKQALVTRSEIRAMCGQTNYVRGQRYYEDGRVIALYQDEAHPSEWVAQVRGKHVYEVTLTIDDTVSGHCHCPAYVPFDFCKHVAASLIAVCEYSKSHDYTRVDDKFASADNLSYTELTSVDSTHVTLADAESTPVDLASTDLSTLDSGGTIGTTLDDEWLDPWADTPIDPLTGRAVQPANAHELPRNAVNSGSDPANTQSGHSDNQHKANSRLRTQPDGPEFAASKRLLEVFRKSHMPAHGAMQTHGTTQTHGTMHAEAATHAHGAIPTHGTNQAFGVPLTDNRELLQVEYICRPVTGVFGVAEHINLELKVGPQKTYVVRKIRDFLDSVEAGRTYPFTQKFTYDASLFRFRPEDLEIIRVLLAVVREESLYNAMMGHYHTYSRQTGERALFITPFVWRTLYPLLQQSYTLIESRDGSGRFEVSTVPPPIHMQITKLRRDGNIYANNAHGYMGDTDATATDMGRAENEAYAMEVSGIEKMIPLPSYGCVVASSTFHMLDPNGLQQFIELQRVVQSQHVKDHQRRDEQRRSRDTKHESSLGLPAWERIAHTVANPRMVDSEPAKEVAQIPIAEGTLDAFMNEVVPGLKQVGHVEIDDAIGNRIVEVPLHAKVYLDRYTNQAPYFDEDVMTARVQFEYGDALFNPFDTSDAIGGQGGLDAHAGLNSHQAHDPFATIDTVGAHDPLVGGDAQATAENGRRTADVRQIVVRDLRQEARILQFLYQSGFARDSHQLILVGEEFIYEFVFARLAELQQWVEVFATSAVDNWIRPAAVRPRSRIEIDTKTNWLDVSFDMGDISEDEVIHVLQSMIERKKYHRLKSGAFVSLQNEEFSELQRVVEDLGLKSGDLKKSLVKRSTDGGQNGINGDDLSDFGAANLRMPSIRALPLIDQHNAISSVKLGRSLRRWLDNLRNPDNIDAELPSGLNATLREYQKFGFQWMKTLAQYGFGGILADDMGLGKTIQTINFLLSEKEEHASQSVKQEVGYQESLPSQPAPVLIVCPASLTYNWKSEIDKFAPGLSAVVVTGDKADRETIIENATRTSLTAVDTGLNKSEPYDKPYASDPSDSEPHLSERHDVIITSYPLLWRDVDLYREKQFSTLILDEAQAIKNHTTQTAQAVTEIKSTHRFALTGTPVENSLEDLWAIFHAVFPSLFGGRTAFNNLSPEQVARRIRPFVLRRLKRDVLTELPDKIETLQTAELTKEQKAVYMAYLAQLQEDTLAGLEDRGFQKGRFQILAGLTRLRQICCHPSLCIDNFRGNSGKLEQLMELVEEYLSANQKMLIFSQFTSMLGIIRSEMHRRGFHHFYLDGQTPAADRLALCDRFNQGEVPIFLISLKAGGTGLNLTGADTVILYDLWWNPAVEQQASDRAHRIGQRNTVQVIRMVTQGTIEEKMYELQQKKRDLIDTVVQANDEGLSALTEEDVRHLLSI